MDRLGLTSEEVAREMSEGALSLEACAADVAVSNTGMPDAAPGGPPAGTQCFAWTYRRRDGSVVTASETIRFHGDRNEARQAAALYVRSRIPVFFDLLPATSPLSVERLRARRYDARFVVVRLP
jgi:nicotinamide mononucleotide (NMN) deamidase PncC